MQYPNAAPDRADTLRSETPIACTLTAAELADRETAWLKVGSFVNTSAPVPGGLAFTFARVPGLFPSLQELVRLEAECCAWMAFEIDELPEGIHLTVTAERPDGERGVREAFGPLTRAKSSGSA